MPDDSPRVLWEDNHCLAVFKPAGWLTMGDQTGDDTVCDWAKRYLKQRYRKPGAVYLGVVHRLDRPVSGVVLFARTSKAASRLSAQFRNHSVKKVYWALVSGSTPPARGVLSHQLVKDSASNRSRVVLATPSASAGTVGTVTGDDARPGSDMTESTVVVLPDAATSVEIEAASVKPTNRTAGYRQQTRGDQQHKRGDTPPSAESEASKDCRLEFRKTSSWKGWTLLEIKPETGRSHQIRVQLSAAGWPIAGDRKYGGGPWGAPGVIGLHAARLTVLHPVHGTPITFEAPSPEHWHGWCQSAAAREAKPASSLPGSSSKARRSGSKAVPAEASKVNSARAIGPGSGSSGRTLRKTGATKKTPNRRPRRGR
jgi:23S rRNA pseudouridine1911/1915/1917 synthase